MIVDSFGLLAVTTLGFSLIAAVVVIRHVRAKFREYDEE